MDAVPARPIRVLWLVKGLGPGGAERLLVAAAARRDRSRFDVTCAYLLPWKQQLVPELEALGVTTRCLDVRDERDVRWAVRLRTMLRKDPVDVLHAHSPYPAGIARLVTRTLPRLQRPATVYTLHNTWTSFATPTRLLNAWTMGRDAADFAVSDLVRDTVPERLRRRTEVVVHGIDLDAVGAQRARDGVRAELGIAPDEIVFGTVANFRAQKDYPNLLAAAAVLRDRGARVRIVAVGQGPLEEQMRAEHARLGLADRVLLLGERADAVRVMSGCDGFVLASNNEGLPVAVMEALALGLPVVGTAVGGMAEAVDATNGVLVPPRDPEALAGAMLALAEDPARRATLAEGAARSSARFDIGRSVTRIEAAYEEVAPGGAAGRAHAP
jgi:glycosyltransferase involved in cell wall biosynthesis